MAVSSRVTHVAELSSLSFATAKATRAGLHFPPRLTITAGIITLFLLGGIFAGVLAPYDPIASNLLEALDDPSPAHLLGTDPQGRDLLSRLLFGGRLSLLIAVASSGLASAISIPLGITAAYFGKRFDLIVMRAAEVVMVFPSLLFALLLVSVLGAGAGNIILSVGLLSVPPMMRVMRSVTLMVTEQDFVLASFAVGGSPRHIIVRHILPNVAGTAIVQATFIMALAIMIGSSLSFLGLGIVPPTPEWGAMMAEARQYVTLAPRLILAPTVCLFVLILAINQLGDCLADILGGIRSSSGKAA